MENHQAFIGTKMEPPPSNEEDEYEEFLALLTKFNSIYKKFVNNRTKDFIAQSYQQPQYYHQNYSNSQGRNNNQHYFNPENSTMEKLQYLELKQTSDLKPIEVQLSDFKLW